jgi:hypothetical protein
MRSANSRRVGADPLRCRRRPPAFYSVLLVKLGSDAPWFKDGRLLAVAVSCLTAGFLIGLLIFGAPWHLRPDWGDLPTWLLFALGVVAGVTGLYQFRVFVENNKEETRRNIKRDELLDKQLAEAEARALMDRRSQAEDIEIQRYGGGGLVINESRRPITGITCAYMSTADRRALALPEKCGLLVSFTPPGGPPMNNLMESKSVGRFARLRPSRRSLFMFAEGLKLEEDSLLVAWFTDDAGFRWELDEYLHLVRASDEDEYQP